MSKECYIGFKNKENNQSLFGIKTDNRRRHMYIVGKTGMGKTTLLNNMILQDIYNGLGVCFIDPHGDSCEYILDRIPPHRHNDVIYFNPADLENPIGLNILEPQRNEENYLITSTLISVFNKIWAGTWSARMEYILSNTLLTLLEKPNSTLLGVIKLLTDDKYRKELVSEIKDPLVKNFWQLEFSKFNSKYRQEAISPILNKIGQFFSSELIRNILGQSKSTIDLRQIMDDQKILIVNLSKGRLGEENSNLLGSLLVSKLQVATMSRVDIPEEKRKDFYLYVDEFQNFTTDSFAGILSEARKYRLNLILAHQYIDQLTENGSSVIKNAVFGNVGTVIGFRVGSNDASFLSQEFGGKVSSTELINLDKAKIAIKLDLDYDNQDPFLAYTLSPLFDKLSGNRSRVVRSSRQNYTIPREQANKQIEEYLGESK
jgi:type IV secretory pathway TraG/TraD family ATPase VirD4